MTCVAGQTAQIFSISDDMKQRKAEILTLENVQLANVWKFSLKNESKDDH